MTPTLTTACRGPEEQGRPLQGLEGELLQELKALTPPQEGAVAGTRCCRNSVQTSP